MQFAKQEDFNKKTRELMAMLAAHEAAGFLMIVLPSAPPENEIDSIVQMNCSGDLIEAAGQGLADAMKQDPDFGNRFKKGFALQPYKNLGGIPANVRTH